jgi:hypothetical protein
MILSTTKQKRRSTNRKRWSGSRNFKGGRVPPPPKKNKKKNPKTFQQHYKKVFQSNLVSNFVNMGRKGGGVSLNPPL